MNKIIIGQQLVKSYGEGDEKFQALNGVNIEVNKGEFVAVMGPSGSGKSTLMFALSGMDRVDRGNVVFDGTELTTAGEKELADIRRTKMGFIFQQPTMLKNLNVLDNIILPAMHGDNRKHAARMIDKARTLMERAGISGLEKRDITQVSGGQLQRAGVCRALMNDPEIIFGDEPTGALNSKTAEEIMDMIGAIHADGTTVMLVTHDAKVAARAERTIFMRDGEVLSELELTVYNGEPDDLSRRVDQITDKLRELGI